MRALSKWSASSLSSTVPRPCQGEPSRRIANLPFHCSLPLEEARVDRIKARIVDGEARQRTISRNDRPCRLGAHVVIGGEAVSFVFRPPPVEDPHDWAQPRREPLSVTYGSPGVPHKTLPPR